MDGVQEEHDGREFAINHGDGSLTLMDVSQSRYAERETLFQCCVNLTNGPQVCGEHYIFDPLGEACMLLSIMHTLMPIVKISYICQLVFDTQSNQKLQ